MKKNKLLLSLMILIFVFACDKDDEQLTCCDFEISYETEYDLSSNWSLAGIIQERPFLEECADGAGGTVTFYEDGNIGGNTACNQLVGKFELTGSNGMQIISLGQTLRGCVNDESAYWEGKYPGELREAVKFEIEGDKLILFTSDNTKLVFKAFE